ncbi:MAG: hypothetical protein AB7Q17_05995 [Phycisphaerae bacterium]
MPSNQRVNTRHRHTRCATRIAAGLLVLAGGVLSAGGQTNRLRLYFSDHGWDAALPVPQPAPDQQNPAFPIGPNRIYLWAQVVDGTINVQWKLFTFRVALDGPSALLDWQFFNPTAPSGRIRWSLVDLTSSQYSLIAIGTNRYGVARSPEADGFVTNTLAGSHVLLGWLDVMSTGPTLVWLEMGNSGVRRADGVMGDLVEFGFGDPALDGGSPLGTRSANFDAFIGGGPPQEGACCMANGVCTVTTDSDCAAMGGSFGGADTTCGPRACRRPADLNCDGAVNNFDIDPFVLAIADAAAYEAAYPLCDVTNADANDDGLINNFDIDVFVECLLAGACPQ